jgi:phosphate transport system permease protein
MDIKHIPKKPLPAIYSWLGDRIFLTVIIILGLSIILMTAGLALVTIVDGWEAIKEFGFIGFITGKIWDPGVNRTFGALPFLFGTAVTSVGSLALAFLPAVAIAVFISEYAAPWLGKMIDNMVNLIAAVPSVVIGIWGIFVFAPWMRETVYLPIYNWAIENNPSLLPFLGNPIGYGMVSATIILALMIIPFITALTKDAIDQVPVEQREAAYALGATHWEVIRMAVIPYARGGILAGSILAFGRAIGETMAVAMLIGNKNTLPFSIFGPAATMPSVIINEFREAVNSLHLSSLMAIGLVLFIISLLVNLLAAYITKKLAIGGGKTA